jgi:hypothetical protein
MAASPIVDMPEVTSLPAHISPSLSQSAWPVAVSFLMLSVVFIVFMLIALILSMISGKGIPEGPFHKERKVMKKGKRQ